MIHIGSQVKTRQSQSYKVREFAKISDFLILHGTHLLKLLDKMCEYEMDPASIFVDTEQTRLGPQPERWMDIQTDGRSETSIPHLQLIEIIYSRLFFIITEHWDDVRSWKYIDGLVQDCSNSGALAMGLLQSCTKPLICIFNVDIYYYNANFCTGEMVCFYWNTPQL